jgi:hypothetical protein
MALGARLRSLEPQGSEGRCKLCGERVTPRSKVELLGDRVRRGEEQNELVRAFFEQQPAAAVELARPEYHRVNKCKHFRKELSETMALVRALGSAVLAAAGVNQTCPSTSPTGELLPWETLGTLSQDWHVIDLCCGKSLTVATVANLFPRAFVTCVDVCDPGQLPHYEAAGLGDRVSFLQVDMLAAAPEAGPGGTKGVAPLESQLEAAVLRAGRAKTAVLGMHCCGRLSVRAVELFHHLKADCIFLVPCCMPSKSDRRTPVQIFQTKDQDRQYWAWATFLRELVVAVPPGEKQVGNPDACSATLVEEKDLMSVKNALISGTRHHVPP